VTAPSFEEAVAQHQHDAQPLPTHADALMADYPGCVPSVAEQDARNGEGLPAVDLGPPVGSVAG
jgi:hypothetical protein